MSTTSRRATEPVATSPRALTVEQAAEVLGISRRAVIQLLADGTLTWTMTADRKTVLVEVPSDGDISPATPSDSAGLDAHCVSGTAVPARSSRLQYAAGDHNR
jgi:excisionase family DNA binding protein